MAPTLRARKPPAPAPAPTATAPRSKPKPKPVPKATPAPKKATSAIAKGKAAAVGEAAKAPKGRAAPKSKAAAAAKATKAAATKATKADKATNAKAKAVPKGKQPAKPGPKAKAAPKSKATEAKSAAPGPALDHEAYPHIFERILAFAPHASLLALRAASHALQHRCDALLAHHIVLGPGLPPPKGKRWDSTAPHLPRGPEKKRARQHRVRVSSALGALPGWVCDLNHITDWADDSCGEQCDVLRERWYPYFEDTRVLDIHPWLNSGQKFDRAKKLFKDAHTVRFYPYTAERLPVPAANIVVFTSLTPADGDWRRVSTTAGVYLDSEPRVQRAVFHARLDCRRPCLPECWVNLPTQFGGWCWPHAALIFEPEPDSPVAPNPEWAEASNGRPRSNGVLWDVANMLRVGSTTSWVIVGASEMPHQICGLSHDPERSHEDFAAAVADNVVAWVREDHCERTGGFEEEREVAIRRQLRFVTNAAYRAEVGEAQWAIDAVRAIKVV